MEAKQLRFPGYISYLSRRGLGFLFLLVSIFSFVRETYAAQKVVGHQIDIIKWGKIPYNIIDSEYGRYLYMYILIFAIVSILRVTTEVILLNTSVIKILQRRYQQQKNNIIKTREISTKQNNGIDPETNMPYTQTNLQTNLQTKSGAPHNKLSFKEKVTSYHYLIMGIELCHNLKVLTSIMVFSVSVVGIFNFKVKLWICMNVLLSYCYTYDENDQRIMYLNYRWGKAHWLFILSAIIAIFVTQYVPQFIQTNYQDFTGYSLLLGFIELVIAVGVVFIFQQCLAQVKAAVYAIKVTKLKARSQSFQVFRIGASILVMLLMIAFPIVITFGVQSQVDGYSTQAFPLTRGEQVLTSLPQQNVVSENNQLYQQQLNGWTSLIQLDQSNGTLLNGLMHGAIVDLLNQDYMSRQPQEIKHDKYVNGNQHYAHTTINYNQTFDLRQIAPGSQALSSVSLQQKYYSQLFTFGDLVTSNRDWIKESLTYSQLFNQTNTTYYLTLQVDFPDMNCRYTVDQVKLVKFMPIQVNHYLLWNNTSNEQLMSHEHVGYVDTSEYAKEIYWWQCQNEKHLYKFLKYDVILEGNRAFIGEVEMIQPEEQVANFNYQPIEIPPSGLDNKVYGQLVDAPTEANFSEVEYISIQCKGQGLYPKEMNISTLAVDMGTFICQYSIQFYVDGDYMQQNAYILTQMQLYVTFALLIFSFIYNAIVTFVLVVIEVRSELSKFSLYNNNSRIGQSFDLMKP